MASTLAEINKAEGDIIVANQRLFQMRESIAHEGHPPPGERRDAYGTLLVNLQEMMKQAKLLEARLLEEFPGFQPTPNLTKDGRWTQLPV